MMGMLSRMADTLGRIGSRLFRRGKVPAPAVEIPRGLMLALPAPPALPALPAPERHWSEVPHVPRRLIARLSKSLGCEPSHSQVLELMESLETFKQGRMRFVEVPGYRVFVLHGSGTGWAVDRDGVFLRFENEWTVGDRSVAVDGVPMVGWEESPATFLTRLPSVAFQAALNRDKDAWNGLLCGWIDRTWGGLFPAELWVGPDGPYSLLAGVDPIDGDDRCELVEDWEEGGVTMRRHQFLVPSMEPASSVSIDGLSWLLGAVRDRVMKVVAGRYAPFAKALREALDSGAVRAFRRVGAYTECDVHGFFAGPDAERNARRLQAFEAMPLFWEALLNEDRYGNRGPWGEGPNRLAEAVDMGLPVIPLFRELGITKGHFRRLAKVPPRRAGMPFRHVVEMCADLRPERMPSEPWEWRLAAAVFSMGIEVMPELVRIVAGHGWIGLARRLGVERQARSLCHGGVRAAVGRAVDVFDCFHDADRRLLCPAALPDDQWERMVDELRRFALRIDVSVAWHAREGEIGRLWEAAAPPTAELPKAWPALFGEAVADGIRMRCLTTEGELAAEGDAMSHCVGGYDRNCRRGWSHIVSVTDAEGKRLSTAELSINRGRAVLVQHRSVRNSAPPPAADAAVVRLLGWLNDGTVAMDPEAMEVRVHDEDDVGTPEQALAVLPVWREILPKAAGPFLDGVEALLRGEGERLAA